MSMLTRVFDVIADASLGLVIAATIVAFGAIMLADFGSDVDADYGNTSNPAQVIDEGESGLLDFSGNFGIMVTAIVFIIIVGLITLVRNSAGSGN